MSEHEFHPLVPWVDDNAQGLRFYTQGQRIVGKPWGECEELTKAFESHGDPPSELDFDPATKDFRLDLSPYRKYALTHGELSGGKLLVGGKKPDDDVTRENGSGVVPDVAPQGDGIPSQPLPESTDGSDAFDDPGTTLIEPV